MGKILSIVQGNNFGTGITIHAVDVEGHEIQDFSLEESTDIRVWYLFAGKETDVEAWSMQDGKIIIAWPKDLTLGGYDIFVEGYFESTAWRNAMKSQFRIVKWNYEAYIPDDVIVLNGIYQLSAEMALITRMSGGGGTPSETLPLMDGEASVGEENAYARGDHRHPSDTNKQDVIADLAAIRSGAAAGASAYHKPSTGIPKTDMAQAVQQSLGKADTALQPTDIIDSLSSASTTAALSANQGKVLNESIQATNAELTELALKSGPTSISPTGNGYINSNVGAGNVVNLTPASTSADWRYYIAEVSAGDLVTVSGRGGNGSRLWAFVDAENKLLTISDGAATSTGLVLTAPANAAKVIVNNNVVLYGEGSVVVEKSDSFPHVLSQTVEDAAFDTLLEVGPITAQPTGNGYVNTNVGVGEVVNLTPSSTSANWRYYIAKVKAGVSVIISGRGGSNSRLWAFIDSEGKLLSISESGWTANSLKLTAPANAAKIVVNNNVALYGEGSVVVKQEDSMIENLVETLPTTKTINVLIIGNSYSYRSTAQSNASLLELCRKAGVKAYVEIVGNGGASFATLLESYEGNTGCGYHWYGDESSGWSTASGDDITIKTAFGKKEWDYIFFHQSSALSGDYSSFSPSLAKLIKAAKIDCTNEQCKIGLMETWAYANNTGTYPNATTGFTTQAEFYAAICSAYQQAVEYYKIDVLVPAGTAIQNARATTLGTDFSDFASSVDDASHINPAGGAIAAMAWFASIWGRINRIPLDTVPQFTSLFTASQFALALTSAKNAIQFPYEVTESN